MIEARVCNYHEKEDPTGFELNSDRNQESEEISCETELEDLRFGWVCLKLEYYLIYTDERKNRGLNINNEMMNDWS